MQNRTLNRLALLLFTIASLASSEARAATPQVGDWAAADVKAVLLWRAPHPAVEFRSPRFPFLTTRELTSAERLSLGASETQLLYGEVAHVLEKQGTWLKVEIPTQARRGTKNGYVAWVQQAWLTRNDEYRAALEHGPTAVVSSAETRLWTDETHQRALLTLSYGTILPVLSRSETNFELRLPDGGIGYADAAAMTPVQSGEFSADRLIEQAKLFVGVRYVWGGTSSEGFDCSGYAYRLFRAQGILLPRNANDQVLHGQRVTQAELQPGDLVFFAVKGKAAGVDHVGIYLGHGQFIHSPNARSSVQIAPLAGYWKQVWIGASRYGH